ncbi:recombinase family protein [Streptomyces sp. 4.24]|uniref:recombinase family protein n=1 Tax=Streptomyces tritrimontium TaxID=3406573 RepID=UPI003BB5EC04
MTRAPVELSRIESYIGYIRVSTWKEEAISPELQRAAIEGWARRTGRRIVEWVVDLDQTGRNFNRKVVGAIAMVEKGEAAGIAVWKYSRFGRSRDGIAVHLERVEAAGGQLESATEEIDARTATGRLQRGILFEFAAYESDKLGEQWRETHDHRRYKLGVPATGRPRSGYIWHPRRLPDGKGGWTVQKEWYEPDVDGDASAYAEAYRRYVDGTSYYALCGWLNTHGCLTVRGNPWSVQVLMRYMDSGFPAGLLRVHDPKCGCGHSGSCPHHMFMPGAHEELISSELWQQYQDERDSRRKRPPRSVKPLYPLTNLAKCDHCRGTAPVESGERKGPDGQKQLVPGYSYCCGRRSVTSTHGCPGFWVRRSVVEGELYDWIVREAAVGAEAAQAALHGNSAERRDTVAVLLEKVTVGEAMLERADFEPLIVGLAQEWGVLLDSQKNALLKQLVHRVAFRRREGAPVIIAVHPLWEPDPWADGDETSSPRDGAAE